MKHFLAATALTAGTTIAAYAGGHADVKIGVILGFTGPIESLTPTMAEGAELAIKEVSDSGIFLGGKSVEPIRADSTCIDAGAATAAAERLVTSDGVKGIMGADCSGVTGAILANVALANGMVMISPSATSPALSTAQDNGLFFRTAPSDARQGAVMSAVLKELGVDEVAVTYTNNDYGKGLSDSFRSSYEAAGGSISATVPHEDGKADYSAEVAALSSAGGERLVVIGYADQGGAGIVQAALDSGAFDTFHFPDGMIAASLVETFGNDLNGSSGQLPAPSSELATQFATVVDGAFDASSIFAPESYDAAALILLAMQAAGTDDPSAYKDLVRSVANAPGEKIQVGELAKGLRILAAGGEIDYVGATGVELIGPGEASGNFRIVGYENGQEVTTGYK